MPLIGATLLLAGCGGQASPAASSASAGGAPKPAASTGGAAASAPAGNAKVRFGINNTSISSTVYWMAQSAGVFTKNGLDVQLDPAAGRTSISSLVAGNEDGIAIGGPQTVLIAIQQGAPIRIVDIPSNVYNVIIVTPNDITSLDQLKGKRVGGQSETGINVTGLKRALKGVGLESGKDYTFVETGAESSANGLVAALLAHQIDAAPLDDVTAAQALKQGGYHVLLDMADPKANIQSAFSVVPFHNDFIQQHHETAQKLVDSLFQATQYMAGHKDETEALLKKQYKLSDPAQIDETYQRQVQLAAKDQTPTVANLTDAATYVPNGTTAIPQSQLEKSIDAEFATDAVKRGLAKY
jgi:ABC-type nitrate/sulfonate/bicarbonate transport system substrate-binding protein